jgi:recombination protein U
MKPNMKDRRYANRGQPFEEFLRFANERYAQKKIALIDKLPTEFIPIRDNVGRICNVKVERKSKVDFIGRYKHRPIAIEAKNSNTNDIRWDRVEPHQADYMDAFIEEPGTIGLILLSFNMRRFFVIPWVFWKAAYDARVRPGSSRTAPVTISAYGTTWDIPKKFSVRIDEIPPEFEIPNHDYDFGLHYLAKAEQYITPLQP